jgi:hypothetical protein
MASFVVTRQQDTPTPRRVTPKILAVSYSHQRERSIHRAAQCALPQGQRPIFPGDNPAATFFKKMLATTIYGATLRPTPLNVGSGQRLPPMIVLSCSGSWPIVKIVRNYYGMNN